MRIEGGFTVDSSSGIWSKSADSTAGIRSILRVDPLVETSTSLGQVSIAIIVAIIVAWNMHLSLSEYPIAIVL